MLVPFFTIIKYAIVAAIVIIVFSMVYIIYSFKNIVPFVPTPKRIVRKMIDLANIQKYEKIIDLGSGTGRIVIPAAKKYKDNYVVGVERSVLLRAINKFFLFFHPFIKSRVQIINKNFFNLDLRKFDVIFGYITPEALRRLTPHFQQLRPGTRLVLYMYYLEDQTGFEEKIHHINSQDAVYVYTKK